MRSTHTCPIRLSFFFYLLNNSETSKAIAALKKPPTTPPKKPPKKEKLSNAPKRFFSSCRFCSSCPKYVAPLRKSPTQYIPPPEYLTAKQKKEFEYYSEMLLALNIFTELDVDVLAQYIIAKTLYLDYSAQIKKVNAKESIVHKWSAIDEIAEDCEGAEELKKLLEKILRRQRGDDVTVLMNLQDKAFKQCLACAKELGLTITSRLKLVIPQPPDGEDDEL